MALPRRAQHVEVDDIQVPDSPVALQSAAYAARMSLADHVRASGPVRDWTDGTRAEAARLQQTLQSVETALREAFEASDLLRVHSGRSLRLSLMRATALLLPSLGARSRIMGGPS